MASARPLDALHAKNLYIQKEQFNLLGEDGKPSLFAPVMLATLSTCAQLERDNITFRLQSGLKQYIAKGGKLGRKPGSVKSADQKKEEYKDSIALLNKGYAIRDVAKLTGKGVSNIQRVKKQFSYEVFLPSCRFGNTNNTVLLLQKDKLDMPFCDKTS